MKQTATTTKNKEGAKLYVYGTGEGRKDGEGKLRQGKKNTEK